MPAERRAPLTNFLISLCHSPELLEQFANLDPEVGFSFEGTGVSEEQQKILLGGNLREIQDAVQAEHPETEAVYAAIWVGVGPIPGPWIFTPCEDEPEADPPEEDPPDKHPPDPHDPEQS